MDYDLNPLYVSETREESRPDWPLGSCANLIQGRVIEFH